MRKILILTNHLQVSDGVCKSAMGLANFLCTFPENEVTLRPLFKYDKSLEQALDKRVILKPKYKFYIKGSKRLLKKLPPKLLYRSYVKDKYDIEIGFCCILPHIAIANSENKEAKHIIWTHGYEYHDYYKKADHIVCNCLETKEKMIKDSGGEIPVSCCHNLTNNEAIIQKGKEPCDLPKSDLLTFISVARMSPEKGFDRLIKSMAKLFEDGYKFRLVLVGDGEEMNKLKALVNKFNLNDYVIFTGSQNNPYKYVTNADIAISSSRSEAYQTALVEALILQTPVISTKVDGAREIIELSEQGFVMDNSEDGIYEGIKKVLDNPELVKKWKEKLKTTHSRFNNEFREKEILDVLQFDH